MDVSSLAYRTDLALLQLGGSEIVDHGTHLVVRTAHNPSFFWGNFLLLATPPAADLVDHWVRTFEQEFPEARHRSFGVDGVASDPDALAPFLARGYEDDVSTVLTTQAVQLPPRPNLEATIRPLVSDDDWEQQVRLDLAGEDEHVTAEFATRRATTERGLTDQGHGRWYGAFLGGRLMASLGIVRASPGLARFQQVVTHPEARNQGLAGTLVHAAGSYALEELDAETLVIVADPGYFAIRIYRSVGFVETETQLAVGLTPPR